MTRIVLAYHVHCNIVCCFSLESVTCKGPKVQMLCFVHQPLDSIHLKMYSAYVYCILGFLKLNFPQEGEVIKVAVVWQNLKEACERLELNKSCARSWAELLNRKCCIQLVL